MSLSPYEQHPSQFKTPELRDPPRLTLGRVLAGIAIAAVVFAFGLMLHWLGSHPTSQTPRTAVGSGSSLAAWSAVAICVGTVAVAWPWIKMGVGRLVGRVRPNGHHAV